MDSKRLKLKALLDAKADLYNSQEFVESDPISIPHLYSKREDIEIAGFLTATISWGQRVTIIKNAKRLMAWMDHAPFEFIMNFKESDLVNIRKFAHRTFNGIDCEFFLWSLKNIYQNYGNLENAFCSDFSADEPNIRKAILAFRTIFFEIDHPKRVEKHIANPERNSAAKRINMFLRWMVRDDKRGVDFGLWNKIHTAQLVCPLDVHSATVARRLGLLTRKNNDWQAALLLTETLKQFDRNDPVKYDFALFGLGINEGIKD